MFHWRFFCTETNSYSIWLLQLSHNWVAFANSVNCSVAGHKIEQRFLIRSTLKTNWTVNGNNFNDWWLTPEQEGMQSATTKVGLKTQDLVPPSAEFRPKLVASSKVDDEKSIRHLQITNTHPVLSVALQSFN